MERPLNNGSLSQVVIIGAGPMGLSTAYFAAKAGHQVTILEADDRIGGTAANFDFDGLSLERFYHFVCKADTPTFTLLAELGLGGKMQWRPTSMGYFIDGKIYPWGNPLALLTFPKLDLVSKFRYGLQMFLSTKRTRWQDLDRMTTKEWILSRSGQKVYDLLWKRLMDLKFYEYADNISAAWIWTRIKRIGTSRKSLSQEELGFIEGGSETLMIALAERIKEWGGSIHCSMPATKIEIEKGEVRGVRSGDRVFPSNRVVSTIPIPYIPALVPDLPREVLDRYAAIKNVGVVCVLHKLARKVSHNFWINIVDDSIQIPGIIEFSNLRSLPHPVVYIPYYMPVTNPKYKMSDQSFIDESFEYLRKINPDLTEKDRIASYVGRLPYAQPVCEPRFLEKLPPVQTPVRGLQIADTGYYYPEDRGISESIRFAREIVQNWDSATDDVAR